MLYLYRLLWVICMILFIHSLIILHSLIWSTHLTQSADYSQTKHFLYRNHHPFQFHSKWKLIQCWSLQTLILYLYHRKLPGRKKWYWGTSLTVWKLQAPSFHLVKKQNLNQPEQALDKNTMWFTLPEILLKRFCHQVWKLDDFSGLVRLRRW